MSTRRSSRRTASAVRSSNLHPSVQRGLMSLVRQGNEDYIEAVLGGRKGQSGDTTSTSRQDRLVQDLAQVMTLNQLSAEMLLARFFDATVLRDYCKAVLPSTSCQGTVPTLAGRIARAWQKSDFGIQGKPEDDVLQKSSLALKRKRQESSGTTATTEASTKKRASRTKDEDENRDDDWKKPLFYWRGTLEFVEQGRQLDFKGSWVAGLAEDGVPSDNEYARTLASSSFELSCKIPKTMVHCSENKNNDGHFALQALCGISGTFQGKYLLDQGEDGPHSYSDYTHKFAFDSHTQAGTEDDCGDASLVVVGATGTTEFGKFVSFGFAKLEGLDPPKIVLILARRYIDDHDARKSWSPKHVLEEWKETMQSSSLDSKTVWTDMLPRSM